MNKWIKNIIIGLAATLLFAGTSFAAQNINVSFVTSTANWQRNSIVTVSVVLTATDEAVSVAGVELHFNYDINKFKSVPAVIADNINSNLFVNDVDVSSANRVTYRKAMNALGSPAYIRVAPGTPLTAFTLRFRVTSQDVQEGAMSFGFDTSVDDVTNRAGASVRGTLANGAFTVIPDTTPPIIVASPTSRTMNISTYTTIALQVSSLDQSGDLQYIRYTIDGSDPKGAGGLTYTSAITIPQNAFTTLRFYGRDNDDNDSSTSLETYTVDTIYPSFTALTSTPSMAKAGTVVTVDLSVSERLQSAPQVYVAGYVATAVSSVHPDYVYRYTLTGSESQGTQNISISMTDLAGNTTTNVSRKICIDFKSPTYSPVLMTPRPAVVGLPVSMVFLSSERLSEATTVSIMGVSASRTDEVVSVNGTYQYTYMSPIITGAERTSLIVVHGVDQAGNASNSNDSWGGITVTGRDLYNNAGSSTSNVQLDFNEGP